MTGTHRSRKWGRHAVLGAGIVMALVALGHGRAEARSTAASTRVKPRTYRQYVSLCKNRPDIPACRQARFYYKRLTGKRKTDPSKHFSSQIRLTQALRKARQQRAAMARSKRGQRGFWRRMWSATRSKMRFLHASWFGKGKKNRYAVKRASPFSNSGGFGHNVQRSGAQKRNSWVYKRGRFKTTTGPQAKKKAKPRRPLGKRRN